MTTLTRAIEKALAALSVALFAVLVAVVVWQVFARQVLSAPQTWTEEAARYLFVWVGLFSAALVFSERGHIAVDFLARKARPGGQRVVAIVVQIVIALFALLVLVLGGWLVARGAWNQALSSLPVTLGQMYLVMPVTGVLIALTAANNVLELARGSAQPFPSEIDQQLDRVDADEDVRETAHPGDHDADGRRVHHSPDAQEAHDGHDPHDPHGTDDPTDPTGPAGATRKER